MLFRSAKGDTAVPPKEEEEAGPIPEGLEQTDQELTEESEINNLRDTKAAFIRKFRAQKEEIKKLEEEEIKRKSFNVR